MFKLLKKMKNNNKGFTMVEVIVVAIVVGVLAIVGLLIYNNLAGDARVSTAENLATAAATYLQTARANGTVLAPPLAAGAQWTYNTAGTNQPVDFTCPANASLAAGAVDGNGNPTVNATIGTVTSADYPY